MVEEDRLLERGQPELVRGRNLWAMSVDVSEIPNWLGCRGILSFYWWYWRRNIRSWCGNDTVSDGGSVSDIVIETCGEKYGTDSKNVTSPGNQASSVDFLTTPSRMSYEP